MGRSLKKGPFVDPKLYRKVEKQNDVGNQGADQDVGSGLHDRARVCRPHVHGAQRQDAYEGVRDRRDGRAQAGRVRSDADVPRSRRQGQTITGGCDEAERVWRLRTQHGIRSNHRFARISPQGAALGGPDSGQVCRRGPGHVAVSAAPRRADAGEGASSSAWPTPKIAGRRTCSDLVVVDVRVDGGRCSSGCGRRRGEWSSIIKKRMSHIPSWLLE